MAAATSQQSSPFIKQLASSDRKIRDGALSSLRTYLHNAAQFSELEFLKLWKGLFYCMWMSDKPLTQQRLARDLADLLNVLKGKENFLGFIDAFWKTVAKEWGAIDALRMDKYLYLVRCYVNQGFACMSKRDWADEELLEEYLRILEDTPLSARKPKITNGIRYHVIDIYVDELDKVDIKRTAPLEKVLAPLRKLGKESFTKEIRVRVEEALEDERIQDWTSTRSEGSVEDGGTDQDEGVPESGDIVDASDEEDGDEDEFRGFGD